MADPRFFRQQGPISLAKIAQLTGAQIARADGGLEGSMVALGPRPLPRPDRDIPVAVAMFDIMDPPADGTGGERERTRLGGSRRNRPPDRLREAVAEVEVGDERLAAGREEPAVSKPSLDPLECPLRALDLEQLGGASGGTLSRHLDRRRLGIAATRPGRRRNDCRRLRHRPA